jgi:hypothetical protein
MLHGLVVVFKCQKVAKYMANLLQIYELALGPFCMLMRLLIGAWWVEKFILSCYVDVTYELFFSHSSILH